MSAESLPYVPPSLTPWVKVCPCCGAGHTATEWNALHFVGYQPDPEEPTLELRNCLCGSTICVTLVTP